MWSKLWDARCPSVFILLTDWVIICLCVCVVFLVSGYRDGAMCRNGPLHFLAGRPDFSGSTSITTWKLNVKQPPPNYSHLSFSVGQCAWTLALQHKHTHLLLFVHTQIYSAGRKWHLMARIANSGSTTNGNTVVKRNPFVSITLKRLVVLTDWLTGWLTDWSQQSFIFVLSLRGLTNPWYKCQPHSQGADTDRTSLL